MRDHHKNCSIATWLLVLLLALVVIGIALTRSRAGVALGMVAGLCCLLLIWRHGRDRSSRRLLLYGLGANLIALLIAFQFGFAAMVGRLEDAEVIEDLRWPVAHVTSSAAFANMPFGSGFGTFVPVYEMFAPRTILMDRYVNHAHDDWLELWLTGGLPAIVLAICFLTWFVSATFQLWRSDLPGAQASDTMLARAASIVVVLLLLHSIVDYPMRTIALMALFATSCALLVPPRMTDTSS